MRPRLPQSPALPAGMWQCQAGPDGTAAPFPSPTDTPGHFQQGMFELFAFQVSFFSSSLPTAQIHIFSPNKRKMLAVTRAVERIGGFFCGIDGLFLSSGLFVGTPGWLRGLALHVSRKLEPSLGRLHGPGSLQGITKLLLRAGDAASELLGDMLCCPPGAWSPCQQLQERLILSWSCCCSPAQLLPLALHPEHCTAAPAAPHPPARGLGAARASPGQEGMWKHHFGGRELWVCAVSSAPTPVPQFPPL